METAYTPQPEDVLRERYAPQAEEVLRVRHAHFGTAEVRVVRVSGEWIKVEIVDGFLRGRGRGAYWGRGDYKELRLAHCRWYPPAREGA